MEKNGLFLLVMSFVNAIDVTAGEIRIDEAVSKNQVKVSPRSSGGHMGQCLQLNMENISGKELWVDIPAGLIFDSMDNSEQDLIITKGKKIKLRPEQEISESLVAMCCQAHQGNPEAGKPYQIKGMAEENLRKLCAFMDRNNLQDEAAQQAIWVLSDGNPLASIEASDNVNNGMLIDFMVREYGLSRPQHKISYAVSSDRAFSNIPVLIRKEFNYNLDEMGYSTLVIQDSAGHTFSVVFMDQCNKLGPQTAKINWRVRNVKPGKYFARLFVNHQLRKEEEISF